MSIVTRTGDAGTTALLFNRRVSKSHPRIEACGCVDELNAALGCARATAPQESVRRQLLRIQQDLIALMGELATRVEDLDRYQSSGQPRITADSTAYLDQLAQDLESSGVSFRGWAMPGGTVHSAALDLARTVCRRAERRVCSLHEQGEMRNPEILVFLNRLSDCLWLLARAGEPPLV